MSKILKLSASNVKRLAAIEITPSGNVVTIGGDNGQGKSSVLDSILWGICGGREVAEMPVRKGEERAVIEIDLGTLKVRRTFTATGGMTLTVTNAEGARYPSPQSILDALLGKLGFDPLEFSRQKAADQYETLRALAGLDFAAIDQARQRAYEERTALGREIKTLEGQLAGLQQFPEAPDQEVSTAAVMDEWRAASARNEQNQSVRQQRIKAQHDQQVGAAELRNAADRVATLEREIELLTTKLGAARMIVQEREKEVAAAQEALAAKTNEVDRLEDVDVRPFQDRIQSAETINRQVRLNAQRAKVAETLTAKRSASDAATRRIEDLDIEKRRMISKSKMPIEGLSFEAGRVVFNGIPFAQLSSAEQLRISVAVGLALNPQLKVLLVRDGSLLDQNSMALLAKMAEEAGAQCWVEVVRTDGECSVIIEDGRVKGQTLQAQPELPDAPVAPAAEPVPISPKPRARRQPAATETPDIFA